MLTSKQSIGYTSTSKKLYDTASYLCAQIIFDLYIYLYDLLSLPVYTYCNLAAVSHIREFEKASNVRSKESIMSELITSRTDQRIFTYS